MKKLQAEIGQLKEPETPPRITISQPSRTCRTGITA
jgi:hypothetical protein